MTQTEGVKDLGITLDMAKAIGAPIPLGRLGQPEDIARVALFPGFGSVILADRRAYFCVWRTAVRPGESLKSFIQRAALANARAAGLCFHTRSD